MESQFMHAGMLLEKHGIPLETLLAQPILEATEGLEARTFEAKAATFSYDAQTQKMKFSVGGRDTVVDFNGYLKAMRMAGFPEAVVRKVPPQYTMDALNWFFHDKLGTVQTFVKKVGNEDNLIAFAKPSLELISIRQMAEAVNEVIGEGCLFERLDHDLSFTNCSALLPSKWKTYDDDRVKEILMAGGHEPVRGKDILIGGVNFSASIMGEHPTEVTAYIYRLICSNGLMSAEQTFKWSRNTQSTDLMEWFKDRTKAAIELLDTEFERIDGLRSQIVPAEHRSDVLRNVFAEYSLSEKLRGAVMERIANDPPRNMYDIVQAITNVVNEEEVAANPLQVRRLQKVGGDMVAKMHVYDTCFSVTR